MSKRSRFLTPDDLAERLGVPRRVIITGQLRHALPWFKVGKALRLDPAAFENFLERRGDPDRSAA